MQTLSWAMDYMESSTTNVTFAINCFKLVKIVLEPENDLCELIEEV